MIVAIKRVSAVCHTNHTYSGRQTHIYIFFISLVLYFSRLFAFFFRFYKICWVMESWEKPFSHKKPFFFLTDWISEISPCAMLSCYVYASLPCHLIKKNLLSKHSSHCLLQKFTNFFFYWAILQGGFKHK